MANEASQMEEKERTENLAVKFFFLREAGNITLMKSIPCSFIRVAL